MNQNDFSRIISQESREWISRKEVTRFKVWQMGHNVTFPNLHLTDELGA